MNYLNLLRGNSSASSGKPCFLMFSTRFLSSATPVDTNIFCSLLTNLAPWAYALSTPAIIFASSIFENAFFENSEPTSCWLYNGIRALPSDFVAVPAHSAGFAIPHIPTYIIPLRYSRCPYHILLSNRLCPWYQFNWISTRPFTWISSKQVAKRSRYVYSILFGKLYTWQFRVTENMNPLLEFPSHQFITCIVYITSCLVRYTGIALHPSCLLPLSCHCHPRQ